MVPVAGTPIVGQLWQALSPRSSGAPIFVHSASDPHAPAWVRAHVPGAVLVAQSNPDGVANAIALARPHLDSPALIVLGDVLLDGAFPPVFPEDPAIAIWREGPPEATRANFGVRVEDDRITELVEKPQAIDGLTCGLGAYWLSPAALDLFATAPVNPRTGEREVTEALRHLLRSGLTLAPLPFCGRYLNVNTPDDLVAAEALFLG